MSEKRCERCGHKGPSGTEGCTCEPESLYAMVESIYSALPDLARAADLDDIPRSPVPERWHEEILTELRAIRRALEEKKG